MKQKTYTISASMLVWLSILIQYYSTYQITGQAIKTLLILLSYFTVLTNILVAINLTAEAFFKESKVGRFFSKPETRTAITVYIVVVGLVYNLTLRSYLSGNGVARLANELLHVVNPLVFLLYWIIFTEKSKLRYSSAVKWLIYPLAYVCMVIIRGALTTKYPYPFINVTQIGYPKALLNGGILMFVFYVLSLFFIFIGHKLPWKIKGHTRH